MRTFDSRVVHNVCDMSDHNSSSGPENVDTRRERTKGKTREIISEKENKRKRKRRER